MNKELAEQLLELSSELRLDIMSLLLTKKPILSQIAKKFEITTSETHRNLSRLTNAQIITKNEKGMYSLTTYGVLLCSIIPSIQFLIQNKSYFSKHGFGNLPINHIQSIGSLVNSDCISGYVRVLECWDKIYKNASKYIYSILHEVSYASDTVDILKSQLISGVLVHSIFTDNAIMPDNRISVLEKSGLQKLIKNSNLERKISKIISVVIVMNEKEASIAFPDVDGKIDVSQIFYSNSADFHNWCLDVFHNYWERSSPYHSN